jgi:hypothetical protein
MDHEKPGAMNRAPTKTSGFRKSNRLTRGEKKAGCEAGLVKCRALGEYRAGLRDLHLLVSRGLQDFGAPESLAVFVAIASISGGLKQS